MIKPKVVTGKLIKDLKYRHKKVKVKDWELRVQLDILSIDLNHNDLSYFDF